jgi:hypothetical protein
MANVLGTLVVNVAANTAEFLTGMSKTSFASRKAGKEIEESFSHLSGVLKTALGPLGELGAKVAETFESVGKSAGSAMSKAGALGGVFAGVATGAVGLGGALVATALHAAELGNQIYEVKQRTGLATETLQGLMAIAKETGGSFEGLSAALAKGEVNLTKATLAGDKANKVLVQMMGGSKGVAELGLQPMDERLQTVVKRIFELHDIGQRNVALTALLGKGWQDNVETLKEWADSADRGAGAAKRFGTAIDPEKAHDLTVKMRELKGQMDALTLTVGSKLMPYVASAIVQFLQLGTVAKEFGRFLGNLGLALGDFVTGNFMGMAQALERANEIDKEATKGLADAQTQMKDTAVTAVGLNEELDKQTNKTKDASNAWEKHYNKVLNDTHYIIPKVLTDLQALAKAQDDLAKQQGKERQQKFVAFAMGDWTGAGLSIPTKTPGGLGPDFQSLQQNMTVLNQTEEESKRLLNLLKQIPPAVSTALTPLQKDMVKVFAGLGAEGKDLAGNLHNAFQGFVSGFEDQLTSLVTTGRVSFRSLFRSLQEEMIHAGIAKLFSSLLGSLFATTPGAPGAAAGGGFFRQLFGGFRQGGGPVTPGRAYVVGEKRAEFFIPNQPGTIRPAVDVQPNHTTVNFHVHGVSDYDSFRRSQAQTLAMVQNQMAVAHSRTR